MKIVTENGFECALDEDMLDDPDIFDDLVKIQRGDMSYLRDVVDGLLGSTGWDDLKEFSRNEKGKASLTRMTQEFMAVLKEANGAKKN